MYIKKKSKINFVIGNLDFKKGPIGIFNSEVINFLNSLSKKIAKNSKAKKFPDLVSFSFWCRKSNLLKLKQNYSKKELVVGKGTVLHICPSNVPMNYAYSFAFGLLSGNNNIVRLPERNFLQVNLLNNLIKKILESKNFKNIKNKICFIKYKKTDNVTEDLSKLANARLIWGGDKTISEFKKHHTNPRCLDLYFANRYSISIINTKKASQLVNEELKLLVNKFYNDTYIMDQQGCSSPQALFWIGKKNLQIKNKFWTLLNEITKKKYLNDVAVTNKKIFSVQDLIIKSKLELVSDKKNIQIIKLKTKKLSKEIEDLQCHFGTFIEADISGLKGLKNIITNRYQTLTYFGFEKNEIKAFILKNNPVGIDRIVPFGRAFDMSPIWDGYDIIQTLSRIIGE